MALEHIKDRKVDFKSASGSQYYFTETGVYRLSNHWGRAANCKWRLQSSETTASRTKLGYADWNTFYPDNDHHKYYFIEVDYDNQKVHYQHKNSKAYNSKYFLRTASETEKIIKKIRQLFENDAWAKHYDAEPNELRKRIIDQLITSNKSISEIKASDSFGLG